MRSVPLQAILTGRVTPLGPRGMPSGIDKTAVPGPVYLGVYGLAGDAQGDTRHHGGPDKALHHYALEHYPTWMGEVGDNAALRRPGAFGENLADAHAVTDPAEADQVMWGQVASADGFHVMAYDVPSARSWNPGEIPVFVSVRGDDADVIKTYWNKLSEGGTVIQPIGPAGFSPLYGMVKDTFGVTWVLDLAVSYPAA